METPVKRTPMPMIAGILCIVDGGLKLLALLGLFVASLVIPISQGSVFAVNASILLLAIAVPLAIIGILAIVGGIFALKRKHWGLALAGAIGGTFTFFPCGIPAIIFISMSQQEFSAPEPAAPIN